MQHFEAVLDGGTEAAPFAHKEGDLWIIDEVVEEMAWRESCVRYRWCSVGIGVHTERRAVDDDSVIGEEGRGDGGVGESGALGRTLGNRNGSLGICSGFAADIAPFDAELFEAATDGLGGATCAEDERFLVMGLQERTNTLGETDDIGVVAL